MVSRISSFSSVSGLSTLTQPKALTDDQKATIQSILSKYDKTKITADTAKTIFKAFKEAGIEPAAGMKEAITAAGFDADKLRTLAFGDQPPQGGPGGQDSSSSPSSASTQTINQSTLASLQSILSQYDFTNITKDQETDLVKKLTDSGLMKSGSLLDLSA